MSAEKTTTSINKDVDPKVKIPTTDYIEIYYSNGEKRKVTFKNVCTPVDAHFWEDKIAEIIKWGE